MPRYDGTLEIDMSRFVIVLDGELRKDSDIVDDVEGNALWSRLFGTLHGVALLLICHGKDTTGLYFLEIKSGGGAG
eukprot:CAMPEP_0184694798 /NCGR_PEP_ID=MMETSP0313-20130426/2647_1 /TAXON_ID=2792 /ORGANISM="Porphyridium aerugineum, Strain SAG 1380-2" /LENGTH=75 /DNA_ID=CAMNT_0027153149 /DNA_START=224 /DNA_END=451 /DNA_ORIENTATION=-